MRLNHVPAIVFSGATWLVIGLLLIIKGLNLIVLGAQDPAASVAWIPTFASLTGGLEQGALLLISIGLFVGFIKGRTVLAKTVKRMVERIHSMPQPIKMSQLYTARYCLLILLMMGLGISIRWMSLPVDVHGVIDVAIGSALINGALIYFRYALALKKV